MLRVLVIIILLPFALMSALGILGGVGGVISEAVQANRAKKAHNQNMDQCIANLKKRNSESTAEWRKYTETDYVASCKNKRQSIIDEIRSVGYAMCRVEA